MQCDYWSPIHEQIMRLFFFVNQQYTALPKSQINDSYETVLLVNHNHSVWLAWFPANDCYESVPFSQLTT